MASVAPVQAAERLLRSSFQQVKSPVYRLLLATANHNRKLLVLAFNANLLASALETGTFALMYLALGVLTHDIVITGVNNPVIANPIVLPLIKDLSNSQLFLTLVLAAVVVQIARAVLNYWGVVWAGYLAIRVGQQMNDRLFALVMRFSFACASRYKVGDLLSYINGGGVVYSLIRVWRELVVNVLMVCAYAAVILWISPLLSLFAIVLSSFLVAMQRYLEPRFKQLSMDTTYVGVELSKERTESIQALRLIHTFGRQQPTTHKVAGLQAQEVPLRERATRLSAIVTPISETLVILTIGGLLIGGFGILDNSPAVVVPALLTFVTAFNRLANAVQKLLGTLNSFASLTGQVSRLSEILHLEDKEFVRQGGQLFEQLQQGVEFRNVSLRYQVGQDWAVRNLSFKFAKGRVLALVGASGAGKSSIADLLVGLYEPTEGAILVDGCELQQYSYDSWRSQLGVVSQDTFIFNTTILDNIRYGLPDASEAQVIAAAKKAQAHDFINELPAGYETVVGERGYRLSGGQRQRVALARAILKQPEILLLDEATSALDSQSERLVQEALGQFQRDRTVLVIAHRLSTIVNADQILVLERGQLVEQGTHRELLVLGGRYATYWQLQSQGDALVV
ncbi:MAG: ABC transporter ATP-binding protein [Spirulinaceae cyanobacterium RM2_2_10]|nr:ABC transporter ATP-binding protein [Spirulinaceae cyanobacterium RM2_2_10]